MNWYRMFDSIQSVRVMGVVAQLPEDALLPQLRVHVHRAGQARRHHRHRDDAGDEELDEAVLLVEDRLSRPIVMNGSVPDILWFTAANDGLRICIFVVTEVELGS